MIKITNNKGFQMEFEALTISVQIGSFNYCSRKSINYPFAGEKNEDIVECPDAEIAIWDKNGNWFSFGSDEVLGYVSTNDVAKWIHATSQAKNLFELSTIMETSK